MPIKATNHLDSLPPEIHILILLQVSSPKDLYSFIQASPQIYNAFNLARDRVLTRVIHSAFHPEVLYDALMLILAKKELPRGPGKKTLGQFYKRFKSTGKAYTSSMPGFGLYLHDAKYELNRDNRVEAVNEKITAMQILGRYSSGYMNNALAVHSLHTVQAVDITLKALNT
ncbi:hypothetical protein MMC14_004213 [Varicellaria rhodocarpa]|nr:hypothetical protein [Varicellaria rhodocarpa]